MQRRPRRSFNQSYAQKYGATRAIRADRMYRCITPYPNKVPPPGTVQLAISGRPYRAVFTTDNCYIEKLFTREATGVRLLDFLRNRRFIVVRSQKFNYPTYQKYYIVRLDKPLGYLFDTIGRRYMYRHITSCDCKDYVRPCKHILAVRYALRDIF